VVITIGVLIFTPALPAKECPGIGFWMGLEAQLYCGPNIAMCRCVPGQTVTLRRRICLTLGPGLC
jgi:hypothetical protein